MNGNEIPYNDLPLLPPKINLETIGILKQLIKANKALAELRGYSFLLPNKEILLNSIVLKEAKDSSEIENIITTHDTLYKALIIKEKFVDSATKEVLNYRSAVWRGVELLKEKNIITTNIIIEIQEELERNSAGIRKLPGTSLKNERTGEVIYTPPVGEDVIRNFLKNLEIYINDTKEEIDPLIKMAIIHYQFESIHPFYDGNGRTGRILNVLYLILVDLIDSPIIYLSSYIIKNKIDYYRLLQEVKINGNWEEWIIFILKALEITAIDTLETIKGIKIILDETVEETKKKLPKLYSKELIELLYHQPYIKINTLEEKLSIERHTASKYLKELEKIGILKSQKSGKEILYINEKLIEILKK